MALAMGLLLVAGPQDAYAQASGKTPAKPGAKPSTPAAKPASKPAAIANPNATKSDSLARKAKIELPLVLKPVGADESFILLPYELPYSGMVELRLYEGDSTGRLLFQENYIQNPGDNRIRLKAKAFKSGKAYLAILTYKGKRYLQPLSF